MNKKGFSIMELLVVIALLGIVVGITMGIGSRFGLKSKLGKTVNVLLADINYAKQLASTENRYVAIDFDTAGMSYSLKRQVDIMVFGTDLNITSDWTLIKTVTPLEGEAFFKAGNVTDFAINSMGEITTIQIPPEPTNVTLNFFVKINKWGTSDDANIAFTKTLFIFPYGGIKIED